MDTSITHWRPFSDIAGLRDRFDQLLEVADGGNGGSFSPRADVVEEEGKIVLKADLPGITPEDVEIEVTDGVLNVSGSHVEEKEEKDKRYVRRERRMGSFSRSMRLPKGVEPDDIEAVCKDGVLELTIPVPEREERTARVEIKAEGA